MHTFDGIKLATKREKLLKKRIVRDFIGKKLKIAAILFVEDAGSKLYTDLKHEAATRVGIAYETYEFSLKNISDGVVDKAVIAKIKELNSDSSVTGIIIQKPWRKTWTKAQGKEFLELVAQQVAPKKYKREQYGVWWTGLTSKISEKKDVDGLHPNTIKQIRNGDWQENNKVLPATCRAVLSILDRAEELKVLSSEKIIIIGKSDLLGTPLYYELLRRSGELKTEEEWAEAEVNLQSLSVELIASKEFRRRMLDGRKLLDASVVVSATGIKGLITGDRIAKNSVVIDVGEPTPDVDFESVAGKAAFVTPVPGGVGPMTVISLLENCADLASVK